MYACLNTIILLWHGHTCWHASCVPEPPLCGSIGSSVCRGAMPQDSHMALYVHLLTTVPCTRVAKRRLMCLRACRVPVLTQLWCEHAYLYICPVPAQPGGRGGHTCLYVHCVSVTPCNSTGKTSQLCYVPGSPIGGKGLAIDTPAISQHSHMEVQ